MASGKLNMVVFITIMVMATMQIAVDAQKTHVVGGSVGWAIPPNPNTYSDWAASESFAVGDVLVFNFTTGTHTAAQVTRTAYDGCTVTNPISFYNTGPASVTLNSSGTHYYICTIPGHCNAGQKVALTVAGAAATPTPTPAPTPTPTAAPTPTPTAAPTPTPTAAPTPTPTAAPTPTPTAAPTPTPTPSPAGIPSSQSPSPTGTPNGASPPPAPGSSSTPSAPGPGGSTNPETPNSANLVAAASPLTFLCIAMAALYYYSLCPNQFFTLSFLGCPNQFFTFPKIVTFNNKIFYYIHYITPFFQHFTLLHPLTHLF